MQQAHIGSYRLGVNPLSCKTYSDIGNRTPGYRVRGDNAVVAAFVGTADLTLRIGKSEAVTENGWLCRAIGPLTALKRPRIPACQPSALEPPRVQGGYADFGCSTECREVKLALVCAAVLLGKSLSFDDVYDRVHSPHVASRYTHACQ